MKTTAQKAWRLLAGTQYVGVIMGLTFKQYRDTSEAFASRLEDRDDWLVTFSRNRDSDILDESNFDAALKTLGGESETVEIVRFGHWACGWVEHIFVHPSRAATVAAIEKQIDDYPVLDEDDFGNRESEAAYAAWLDYGCREFAEVMQSEFDLMDSTRELLMRSPDMTLYTFENSAPYALSTEGDRVHVKAYGGQTQITRPQMANMLMQLRKGV